MGMHALLAFLYSLARVEPNVIKRSSSIYTCSRLHSLTWCQEWDPEKIPDPPGETFPASRHQLIQTQGVKVQ